MNVRERLEGVRRRANFAFVGGETPFASHIRAIYDLIQFLAECQMDHLTQEDQDKQPADEEISAEDRLQRIVQMHQTGSYPDLADQAWLIRQARKLVNPLQYASNEELFKELAERMNG